MKTSFFKKMMVTTLFLSFVSIMLNGQPYNNKENGKCYGPGIRDCVYNLPDLTEEQRIKIDELRLTHRKDMLKYQTQLQEKNAHLNTLQITDQPDMQNINKTIDEIGKIKSDILKARIVHRQEIRKLLTDEQKIIFDQQSVNRNGHRAGSIKNNPGNQRGYGRQGNGTNCPYRN